MHNYYVTPGLVDKQACMDDAERRLQKHEEPSIVHTHKHGEPCMGKCIGYFKEKSEE